VESGSKISNCRRSLIPSPRIGRPPASSGNSGESASAVSSDRPLVVRATSRLLAPSVLRLRRATGHCASERRSARAMRSSRHDCHCAKGPRLNEDGRPICCARSWRRVESGPAPRLVGGGVVYAPGLGEDGAIVQTARVSYGSDTRLASDDRRLIRYLMCHECTTPSKVCEIKALSGTGSRLLTRPSATIVSKALGLEEE